MMISKKTLPFLVAFAAFFSTFPLAAEPSLFRSQPEKIHVNNRVLATINGKVITVMDVMKKLDLVFYRNFPEYASSAAARYQFYQAHWGEVLQDLIDKELVLADAEEMNLPLTNGDIRQEMEETFGPDIIHNLDKAGLTYDEAWDSIKGDIIIRRMLYYRVNTKAQTQVTPQAIQAAYEQYAQKNVRPKEWSYYMISVRDEQDDKGAEIANQIYQHLQASSVKTEALQESLKIWLGKDAAQVSVSTKLSHLENEVTEENKQILSSLSPGNYSKPIAQKSRATKSTVYRLFYLDSFKPGGAPSYDEMKERIKNNLIEEAINKETHLYLEKLRARFGVNKINARETLPKDFEPFSLN
ncbi:peptidylprolyl isomerase [Parachlamydia sp. AcF125]|uniref:peptidylprolyl isomerase n=1 Tax=Parachlamydia sp. AcF125 TaxID=2795736 RepID=UPI001BC9BD46|nr:peptidylprolyl isomerase [Parachlamydia sp. AcF125]MBS4167386.1 Chaperone SurA [Parachlamydia sp. AcF125]